MQTSKDFRTLKQEQKDLALELHNFKAEIKKTQKENGSGSAYTMQFSLLIMKKKYRYRHIAYSMMRGKTYSQIENKCEKGNEPDLKIIQGIINEYTPENVCVGA